MHNSLGEGKTGAKGRKKMDGGRKPRDISDKGGERGGGVKRYHACGREMRKEDGGTTFYGKGESICISEGKKNIIFSFEHPPPAFITVCRTQDRYSTRSITKVKLRHCFSPRWKAIVLIVS